MVPLRVNKEEKEMEERKERENVENTQTTQPTSVPVLPAGWHYASCLRCVFGAAYGGRFCPEMESPVLPGDQAGCFCSAEALQSGKQDFLVQARTKDGRTYLLAHVGEPGEYRAALEQAFGGELVWLSDVQDPDGNLDLAG